MGATMSGNDVTTDEYHLYPLGEIGLFLPVRPLQGAFVDGRLHEMMQLLHIASSRFSTRSGNRARLFALAGARSGGRAAPHRASFQVLCDGASLPR